MKDYSQEIHEFYKYVNSFYNLHTGIYPIATKESIHRCVNFYLESKPLSEIYFDSFDREQVRVLIGK